MTADEARTGAVDLTASSDPRGWLRAGVAVAAVGWGAQQFAPLLLMYQSTLGLSTTTVQGTFGFYVLGLIPGLLFGGPMSDRYGRRRVMAPTLVVSAVASLLLILGGTGAGWLFAGRLLAGVASGAAFSSGAAWIKELSASRSSLSPRRITVAMSVGFGLGPLVSGVLAQWGPAPTVVPYLPHLLLAAVAFFLIFGAPRLAFIPARAACWDSYGYRKSATVDSSLSLFRWHHGFSARCRSRWRICPGW
ncbi:MFS transporter [Fodinicola feengrottensis]|uniref:MFS transporter n=1 Tax=Fodinicola feengrottensis TaxID=435914 RepID=UPI002442954A|nr:MFS transporter [Fodinicola feengrottensis]